MRKASTELLLLVVALTLGAGVASADVTIDCPLTQARRTITNQLPSGWWTTPIVNNLSETKIMPIGGKPALLCVYGSSGSVQRNAPAGHTCRAVTGGFRCAPTGPAIHKKGLVEVPQTYTVDFDTGTVGSGGADLWFQAETSQRLYLVPRNGARMAVGDRSNRGHAGCARARFSTSRVALGAVPVGSYVCMRTNQGRISQFRMNGISGGSPKRLSIGFTTWAK